MDSIEALDTTFERLARGATATLSSVNAFWGVRFAMLTDRYGIRWILTAR